MTESIFAPFVVDTEEGIRKVIEVLEGPPAYVAKNPNVRIASEERKREIMERMKQAKHKYEQPKP